MVSILLVLVAQRGTASVDSDVIAPIGLSYLQASLVQAGYSVRTEVLTHDNEVDDLAILLADSRPTIVGISATGAETKQLHAVASKAKSYARDIKVIAGGYCSLDAEALLANHAIDIVVHGEGEQTIVELAKVLLSNAEENPDLTKVKGISFRGPFGVARTGDRSPLADLDSLPPPVYDHYPGDRRMIRVYSSRGCPYSCNFCRIKDFYGTSSIRKHSSGYMRSTMISVLKRMKEPANLVYFNDDEFLLSPSHFLEMVKIVRELKLRMCFQTRTQDVVRHASILREHSDAIYQIHMGVESFSQSQLIRWNKSVSVQTNWDAVRVLSDASISYYPYLILSDEETTIEELTENCSGILELPPSIREIRHARNNLSVPISPVEFGLEFNRMKDLYGQVRRNASTPWLEPVWKFLDDTFKESKHLSDVASALRFQEIRLNTVIGQSPSAALLRERIATLPKLALEAQRSSADEAAEVADYASLQFIEKAKAARFMDIAMYLAQDESL